VTPKARFIVFYSDGGWTYLDPSSASQKAQAEAELDKQLDLMNKENVHLLIVAMGGTTPLTVAKYDDDTGRRTGQYYEGTTAVDLTELVHMRNRVHGAKLICTAPDVHSLTFNGEVFPCLSPNSTHLDYSFPAAAGGLYANATQSNLRIWLIAFDCGLFLLITLGGGGRPRWSVINPRNLMSTVRDEVLPFIPRLLNRLNRK
jgi:hypothetical protein